VGFSRMVVLFMYGSKQQEDSSSFTVESSVSERKTLIVVGHRYQDHILSYLILRRLEVEHEGKVAHETR
jgi:hypothetical protein